LQYVTGLRLFAAGDGKCVKSYNTWKCFLQFSIQTMVSAATHMDVPRFAIGSQRRAKSSHRRMRLQRVTNSQTFATNELVEDIKKGVD
jgi:hypothetical protein